MFIELEPVFNNVGAKKDFQYAFVPADSGISQSAQVKGCVENRAGVVTLTADVALAYDTVCDRCLQPVRFDLKKQFSHVLVRALNDAENDNFIVIDDFRFDLDTLLREDILLFLPSKVLCKEDCKGLCATCGADLNLAPCGCKKPLDPRLAVLQELLTDR